MDFIPGNPEQVCNRDNSIVKMLAQSARLAFKSVSRGILMLGNQISSKTFMLGNQISSKTFARATKSAAD
jgi:hypothetical protein